MKVLLIGFAIALVLVAVGMILRYSDYGALFSVWMGIVTGLAGIHISLLYFGGESK